MIKFITSEELSAMDDKAMEDVTWAFTRCSPTFKNTFLTLKLQFESFHQFEFLLLHST